MSEGEDRMGMRDRYGGSSKGVQGLPGGYARHRARVANVSKCNRRRRPAMRFLRRLAPLLIATVWLASPAGAQTPRGLVEVNDNSRRGFWTAFGLGAGAESYDLRDG